MSIKPEKLAVARSFAKELNETMLDDCIDFPYLVHGNAHRASTIIERLCFEIEQLQAAQPKWISVEDRLPGDPLDGVGDVVELLIDKGDAKEVLPGYYDHDEKDWVIYFGDILGDYRRKVFSWWRVIKWRPFPEPPKEEA